MIIVPSLAITALVLFGLIALSKYSPRIAGNTLLILLSALIAWSGGATLSAYGVGYLFLIFFPLFILPALTLINRTIPWGWTVVGGTLLFSSITGLAVKVTNYEHWKQFGNTDADFTAMLWQVMGFTAGCTFGIALVVTLICLGVRKLRER